MPKISIILTSYNHEKFLRDAINSVLKQSVTDFELIIWDDASTDSSWEIINSYCDPRIKIFQNNERKRNVAGLNRAISEISMGKYIAIHHSDDVWAPDKLKQQVAVLESRPDIGAVFTNALAINEQGLPLEDKQHFYQSIFNQQNRSRFEWLNFFFTKGNALCHPSVLVRKECYLKCGVYRYGLAQLTDFDMWIRICLKYEIFVINEKLMHFRVLDNNANSSGARPETIARTEYEFYKLLENFRKIKTLDELSKIFPKVTSKLPAKKWFSKFNSKRTKADIDYLLAEMALQEKGNHKLRLFALNILFEMIGNPSAGKIIKENYDFDYISFINLTGESEVI